MLYFWRLLSNLSEWPTTYQIGDLRSEMAELPELTLSNPSAHLD